MLNMAYVFYRLMREDKVIIIMLWMNCMIVGGGNDLPKYVTNYEYI